jgi:hypothetical protein
VAAAAAVAVALVAVVTLVDDGGSGLYDEVDEACIADDNNAPVPRFVLVVVLSPVLGCAFASGANVLCLVLSFAINDADLLAIEIDDGVYADVTRVCVVDDEAGDGSYMALALAYAEFAYEELEAVDLAMETEDGM